ncbi:hypothetical protein [Yersinia alsatica]|uniref:hypothetical protein n=1 Tax=Yersinia alsatica TaxID=2890317 RepID=UPI000B41E084|nr:hypothetical protein [Yersinia alsatica]OVZ91735.1 hypothetical protein CBW58_12035 [Yersinia frederiksenii]
MSTISYPLVNSMVSRSLLQSDSEITNDKIIGVEIDEVRFPLKKDDGVNAVLNELCKKEWVNSINNPDNNQLGKMISTLMDNTLAEILLGNDNTIRYTLPLDHDTVFRFEGLGQLGVNAYYSVVHSQDGCELFKLSCEFSFDKNCQLSNKKPSVSIDYYPQCPEELKQALDNRTIMQKVFDWLRNIFIGNTYNSDSSIDTNKTVTVKISDKLSDLDNIDSLLQSPTKNYYTLTVGIDEDLQNADEDIEAKEEFLKRIREGDQHRVR